MNRWFTALALTVLTAAASAGSRTVELSVPSMDCPVCPITVKKALTRVPGVTRVEVDFDQRLATVTYDDTRTEAVALTQATTNAGYPSTVVDGAM